MEIEMPTQKLDRVSTTRYLITELVDQTQVR